MSLAKEVERSLVELEQADPHSAAGLFCFEPDLTVFEGHFPGYPLVPAVYLIEATRLTCERALGRPLTIRRIDRAKFTGEVHPSRTVRVHVVLSKGDGIGCQATCSEGETTCAKIKLTLGEHASDE